MDATLYLRANVYTGDPRRPRASALRVEGGRITDVGGPEIGRRADRRVDLAGATVLPGLVDAHLHLAHLGALAREVDLRGARSEEEAARRVAARAARDPGGGWIRGRNWDQSAWPGARYPTRASLDALVGGRPVALTRVDGHSMWVNGAALARAGLSRSSTAPPGGALLRDGAGELSGVLVDCAMDAVLAALPPLSPAELAADLAAAMARCAAAGLTGVHDLGVTPAMLEALEALEARGELPIRVTAYLHGTPGELVSVLERLPRRSAWLRVAGVKLFLDGALGSHGAALDEPYADEPRTRGLLLRGRSELSDWIRIACPRGQQLAIHAIGDRANALALEVIAEALPLTAPGVPPHRVEHAQIVPPPLMSRFAALGVVASVQPAHAVADRRMAEARLGPGRLAYAYPLRRFVAAGVPLAFGSDAPIASESPWHGILAAVERREPDGEPEGGFLPAERLTVPEALDAYVRGPRRAAGDAESGELAPGRAADLVVIALDPFVADPLALAETRPLMTIVGGRVAAGTAVAAADAGRTAPGPGG